MQKMSQAYKKAMKEPMRNRAYGKVYIGVFNSEALSNVTIDRSKNNPEYFSDYNSLFNEHENKEYATCELNFARLDGTQYFPPPNGQGYDYYKNGFISSFSRNNTLIVSFTTPIDQIRGLTIDFGNDYIKKVNIKTDRTPYKSYNVVDGKLIIEDYFSNVEEFYINATSVDRLRVNSILFGVGYTFSNNEIINISCTDYVSSITDSLPSRDVTVNLINNNQMFSPDNPSSVLSGFEAGQEVKFNFGMTLEDGSVEWSHTRTAYLNTWSATEEQATITAVDRLENMNDNYYCDGDTTTLYDLAVKVFQDMGIPEEKYYITEYLKTFTVQNLLPIVRHKEALQIIANAGKCVLYEDKDNKIHIESSFVANAKLSGSNYDTAYGKLENVLINDPITYVSYTAFNGSSLNGTTVFPDNPSVNAGFVSTVSNSTGTFSSNPEFVMSFEVPFSSTNLTFTFGRVAPPSFIVEIDGNQRTITNTELKNTVDYPTQIEDVRQIKVIFNKTQYGNSRIYLENVDFGSYADYKLTYDTELTKVPLATRERKIRNIKVVKHTYTPSNESKVIKTETFYPTSSTQTFNIYLDKPYYRIFTAIKSGTGTVAWGSLHCSWYEVQCRNLVVGSPIEIEVTGTEYIDSKSFFSEQLNLSGEDVEWDNPLITNNTHAEELATWLDDFYQGDVSYQIDWRGDPRTEANDLFLLELKNQDPTIIRAYKNTINFNGAFSGQLEARRAVL